MAKIGVIMSVCQYCKLYVHPVLNNSHKGTVTAQQGREVLFS